MPKLVKILIWGTLLLIFGWILFSQWLVWAGMSVT